MALSKDQLIKLAKANAKASLNPSVTYSFDGEKLSAEALNKTFIKEFELVYETEHPNILGIYAIHLKCFDHTSFSFSVLMDLGETDWEIEINQHYNQNKYYTEKELMSILKQLTSGLVYLQKQKKIAHRDVKPENIIIFKNNVYKLGDADSI